MLALNCKNFRSLQSTTVLQKKRRCFNLLQMCRCPKGRKHQSPARVFLSSLSVPPSRQGLVGPCVAWPPRPTPASWSLSTRLCPPDARAEPHVGESLPPQHREDRCVSGFLGSPGVEVTSRHGQLPLAPRLEAAIGQGEGEPARPRIETQAPDLAECGH